jgi:hypothetical protein
VAIEIGPSVLNISDEPVTVEGESISGGRQNGVAVAAEVLVSDGTLLEIGLVTWDDHSRDIRAFSRLGGLPVYDRLTKGARLGVHLRNTDLASCDLGLLRNHPDKQPTVTRAELTELNTVLGSDVPGFLGSLGAVGVGTRAEILGDFSNRRNYLAASFAVDNFEVPMSAYVLTRVLPLMRGFGAAGLTPVGLA